MKYLIFEAVKGGDVSMSLVQGCLCLSDRVLAMAALVAELPEIEASVSHESKQFLDPFVRGINEIVFFGEYILDRCPF